jgi:hypothetical protein
MSNQRSSERLVVKQVTHLQRYGYDNIFHGFVGRIFRFSWPILPVFLRSGHRIFPVAIQEDRP